MTSNGNCISSHQANRRFFSGLESTNPSYAYAYRVMRPNQLILGGTIARSGDLLPAARLKLGGEIVPISPEVAEARIMDRRHPEKCGA